MNIAAVACGERKGKFASLFLQVGESQAVLPSTSVLLFVGWIWLPESDGFIFQYESNWLGKVVVALHATHNFSKVTIAEFVYLWWPNPSGHLLKQHQTCCLPSVCRLLPLSAVLINHWVFLNGREWVIAKGRSDLSFLSLAFHFPVLKKLHSSFCSKVGSAFCTKWLWPKLHSRKELEEVM